MSQDESTRLPALSAELAARIADLQRRLDARAVEAGGEVPAELPDSVAAHVEEPPILGVLPRAQARPSRPPPPPTARAQAEVACGTLRKQPRARLERAALLAIAVAIACGLGSYSLVADWLRRPEKAVASARVARIHSITPLADGDAAPAQSSPAEALPLMAARRSAPRAELRSSRTPNGARRSERFRSALQAPPRSAEVDSTGGRDGSTAHKPMASVSRVDAFASEARAVPSLAGQPTRAGEWAIASHSDALRSQARSVSALQAAPSRLLTPPSAAPTTPRVSAQSLAAEVSLLDFSVRGSLPRSVVHQALTRVLPQFSACQGRVRDASSAGAGAIRFDVSIDEVGRVRRPVVSGAAGAELERCLVAACAKLVSRAPDTGTVSVSWTLRFTPARSSQTAPIDRGF
jgi:hypothetical protein